MYRAAALIALLLVGGCVTAAEQQATRDVLHDPLPIECTDNMALADTLPVLVMPRLLAMGYHEKCDMCDQPSGATLWIGDHLTVEQRAAAEAHGKCHRIRYLLGMDPNFHPIRVLQIGRRR